VAALREQGLSVQIVFVQVTELGLRGRPRTSRRREAFSKKSRLKVTRLRKRLLDRSPAVFGFVRIGTRPSDGARYTSNYGVQFQGGYCMHY
jgi:hypothetical protein